MNSPQNTEENPDDPEPTNEADLQMKDSSAYLDSPIVEAVTENYL
jgi:hypothetical protein